VTEYIVYLNGRLVPDSQATISVHDSGFTLGDTVYEACRTFNGVPFKLRQHLERLRSSLTYARIDLGMTMDELEAATYQTIDANRGLLHGDFWVYHYISRGMYTDNIRHYLPVSTAERPPTVVITCKPIDFRQFVAGYRDGVHAVIPPTRRDPAQCVDPKIKTCSRMNMVLAEYEAKLVDVNAWSLLLDIHGNVAENKSGNVFIVRHGALYTPSTEIALPGISRATVLELAGQLDIPAYETDLQPYHVITAEEAFFTSTSYCIMPITKVNGIPIGSGKPGSITRRLFQAWSELVGVDILGQAITPTRMQE